VEGGERGRGKYGEGEIKGRGSKGSNAIFWGLREGDS